MSKKSCGKNALFVFILILALSGWCRAGEQSGEAAAWGNPDSGEQLAFAETLAVIIEEDSLVHIFKKGGPIMWPLLMVSILAMGAVFERSIFLIAEQGRRDPKALKNFFEAIRMGDIKQALQISSASKFYVLRTLGYALEHRETSLASALMFAQKQEIKRFRAGIPILDTVITLAPLLGLLGTVTGMMGSFSLIGGELSAPGAITGGIAEALIATAFGLGIAITALVPFNLLNIQVEKARLEIESAATQLELLMEPPAKPAAEKGKRLKSRPAKVVGKIAWRGRSEKPDPLLKGQQL
jgi:biopolymer transport protein ExbB